MSNAPKKSFLEKDQQSNYKRFEKVNGLHPLQDSCPDSFIKYQARKRKGGKIAFFNFDLAKEMGLIPKNHPCEMNKELEEQFLDTFSLVIINEYDIINNVKYDRSDIMPNDYMATRYLQLQHPNKKGETSGDGRSIWNGHITKGKRSWDISSCGTGATSLSPATHIENKYFQTGDPTISYGCGYSEIDEGFATLFFSEILRKNGYATERVLGIIEFEDNLSINIRSHENLLRPSHLFAHLKQNNYEGLKNIVDYYIARQEGNGAWTNIPKTPKVKYKYFMQKQIEVFAKLSADFEDVYIFCWLDWDGDNILMDGGIIDYGSVRQFGLFHHEYRYDDVQRYSTTIKEQKDKAKHIAKVFVQITDYLITKDKKRLDSFDKDKHFLQFEETFIERKNHNILKKMGLTEDHITSIMKKRPSLVEDFREVFSYFERAKSVEGLHHVPDGINWNAIFCMRDILRELPQILLHRGDQINRDEFIEILKSSYAIEEDLEISPYRAKKIDKFQNDYERIIKFLAKENRKEYVDVLLEVTMRSSIINKYDRVTGDSITNIVDRVVSTRKSYSPDTVFELMNEFTEYQNLNPDDKKKVLIKNSQHSKEMRNLLKIVRDYREGI